MWQQRCAILVAGSGRSLLCNVWLSAWSQKHVVSSVRNHAWCILLCQSNAVQSPNKAETVAETGPSLWFVSLSQSKLTRTKTQHSGTVSGLFYIYQQPKAIFVFWAWSCCWSLPLFSPSLQLLFPTASLYRPSALCLCSYYSSALAHFSILQTSFHFQDCVKQSSQKVHCLSTGMLSGLFYSSSSSSSLVMPLSGLLSSICHPSSLIFSIHQLHKELFLSSLNLYIKKTGR